LVVSIPSRGFNPLYGTAAVLGAVLIGGFAAIVLLLIRGQVRAARVMRSVARRIPFLDEAQMDAATHRVARRLQTLAADRRLVRQAVGWAAANWLLDAASLWVFVGAFGHWVSPPGVLVAFGLANVLAVLPITPAGLGVVEAVLIPVLVGFGAPRGVATLGVLAYRLVNFWLPIPLGGLAYLSLTVRPEAPARRRAEKLRELAEQSLRAAEDPHAWAERHGLRTQPRPVDASDPAED
jgi:putative heme transporter